jgi:hypothetical protein
MISLVLKKLDEGEDENFCDILLVTLFKFIEDKLVGIPGVIDIDEPMGKLMEEIFSLLLLFFDDSFIEDIL